uniref:Uncharacterized protein LOC104236000 isoform X7 n=1 Tax=Nicotiana sylvestris TaxID=4096 RepID=A0A1U7XER1_NICSY|nr:PREDICTED: uncharacterized protein LOC104236000 isoform X7 [Nicotiana sylvestris]
MFDKIPQPIVFQEFQNNGKRVDMRQCRGLRKNTTGVLSLYQRMLRSQNSSTELCSKGLKEGLRSLQYLMLASRSDLSVQLTVILVLLNALLRFKKGLFRFLSKLFLPRGSYRLIFCLEGLL